MKMDNILMPYNLTDDGNIDYTSITEKRNFLTFDFEKSQWGDWRVWFIFMRMNLHIPIIVGLIYVATIFGIQHLMKNRKPFHLKKELFYWNAALGLFSIIGFLRTAPDLLDSITQKNGFYQSVCMLPVKHGVSKPLMFWIVMFSLSKFVELGDTVFIVLRCKPLVVLQWFHHFITLIGAWVVSPYLEPVNIYIVVINLGVHSFMYPYFALKAKDVKIPTILSNFITTIQLGQMLINLFLQGYSGYLFYQNSCYRHPTAMLFIWTMNIIFVYLFGNLFYNSVIRQRKITQTMEQGKLPIKTE